MNNWNLLKSLLLISLFVSLCSCTPKPPDVPACEKLSQRVVKDPKTDHLILKPSPTCMKQVGEPECGHCTFIVSGKEIYVGEKQKFFLNGKPWSQIDRESIRLPAVESYAPIASYMINACEKNGCSADIQRFKVKLDSLKEIDDVLNPGLVGIEP